MFFSYIKNNKEASVIQTQTIGFVGIDKQDLLIYLASILCCLGYKVAVFDHSHKGLLQYCIPESEGDFDKVTYRGIDYQFSKPVKERDCELYDVILVDMGEWTGADYIAGLDNLYLVTDSSRYHTEKYIELLLDLKKRIHVIFKNMCDCKINRQYLIELMKRNKVLLGKTYEIRLDPLDYEYEIRMHYEPYQEFKSLSKDYESLLCALVSEITGVDIQGIKRAFNRARKGGAYCK